ncbi:MAG: hypothetical protein BroJett018_47890 [Chloroflexota bacterium]|nr:hypothetical protein [Chloroflexota bacterium]NOG65831.1 hypothetical protein [Chloroflexota bacterium]GIK66995.1 MAG: hypothetical protein BroJett018_47890 [Chloroflexota bacterium]
MIFNRSKETQHVNLISGRNKHFIQRKPGGLDRRREVYYNLRLKLGVPASALGGCNSFVMIGGLTIGLFGLVAGGVSIVASLGTIIDLLPHWKEHISDISMMVVLLFAGIVGIMVGYRYMLHIYLLAKYAMSTAEAYDTLAKMGKLAFGEIARVEKLNEQSQAIFYKFILPSMDQQIEGRYVTSVHKEFLPGDRVAILFSNKDIHIVL